MGSCSHSLPSLLPLACPWERIFLGGSQHLIPRWREGVSYGGRTPPSNISSSLGLQILPRPQQLQDLFSLTEKNQPSVGEVGPGLFEAGKPRQGAGGSSPGQPTAELTPKALSSPRQGTWAPRLGTHRAVGVTPLPCPRQDGLTAPCRRHGAQTRRLP